MKRETWARKHGYCDLCKKHPVPVLYITVGIQQVRLCKTCLSDGVRKIETEVDQP